MSNFQTLTPTVQGVPGTAPRVFAAVTSDSLATILATGYLNDLGDKVKANDFMFINYADTSNYPLTEISVPGQFYVSFDGTNYNLVQAFGASQNIQVPITAAQFIGMYAAPVLLIPAPGALRLLLINSMQLIMTYGSIAYTAGGPVAAQYEATIHGGGVLASNAEAAADFYATANTTYPFVGVSGNGSELPFSTTVNQGIYLSNTTAPFATGNSTFVANINYSVLTV